MANGVLCDSWGFFCVFVNVLQACFKTFSIFVPYFHLFVEYDIMENGELCHIIFCITQSNYWVEDTDYCPCPTISQQSPCRMSYGQSQQRLVFEHGSFHLAFVTLQTWHFAWFFPGTFLSHVSILTLMLCTHTMTTVDTT